MNSAMPEGDGNHHDAQGLRNRAAQGHQHQQGRDHHVPGQHVGEEPDHEGERLGEHAQKLDGNHHQQQRARAGRGAPGS